MRNWWDFINVDIFGGILKISFFWWALWWWGFVKFAGVGGRPLPHPTGGISSNSFGRFEKNVKDDVF